MKAEGFRFDGSEPCRLRDLPCGAGSREKEQKDRLIRKTADNLQRMAELQDAFYADGREGLVVVLQALDAAGKDSMVKHVMGGLNPQGVTVHSFKQPGKEELAHDYLWRVNRALPARGSIAIFNRSYYEDVLVVQVHDLQKTYRMAPRVLEEEKREFFRKRYRQIRQYEEYLYENSYRVVKILLHVSKDKQKERFLERIETPAKNWKFSADDLKERALFDTYTRVFDEVVTETASAHSPWYVIPADQKWYARYLVSEIVTDALDRCCHEYPQLSPEARARLREHLGVAPGELLLGHVGRFSAQKNHAGLLRIFAAVRRRRPDARLLLLGTGPLEQETRALADRLGVADRVIFAGVRTNVQAFYHAMDAFLLPSLFEGLPVVLVEAQAAGLPCFVADTIDRGAAFASGVEFLPLEDPEAWADALAGASLARNPLAQTQALAAGFDVRTSAEILQAFYLRRYAEVTR